MLENTLLSTTVAIKLIYALKFPIVNNYSNIVFCFLKPHVLWYVVPWHFTYNIEYCIIITDPKYGAFKTIAEPSMAFNGGALASTETVTSLGKLWWLYICVIITGSHSLLITYCFYYYIVATSTATAPSIIPVASQGRYV